MDATFEYRWANRNVDVQVDVSCLLGEGSLKFFFGYIVQEEISCFLISISVVHTIDSARYFIITNSIQMMTVSCLFSYLWLGLVTESWDGDKERRVKREREREKERERTQF